MYSSGFANDITNMLASLRNSGLQMKYIDHFLADFDGYCKIVCPDADLLTSDIAEKWIRSTDSKSKAHMSRRVRAMKHVGLYQLSLGKPSYIPNYTINRPRAEEPRLFTDEQLAEFFEKVDSEVMPSVEHPYKDVLLPVMFRLIYCCGLRTSEACNLKVEDVDLDRGVLSIYRSKGIKDRAILIDDGLIDLCRRFHRFYSNALPDRIYFFQPSVTRLRLTSDAMNKFFNAVLLKTSFHGNPGKKFTPHGLRHLFAVKNIKKCVEQGEDFANWMQFLCKYMGHKHIRYTMYYLHITSHLFPIYSEKLKLLEEGVGVLYAAE